MTETTHRRAESTRQQILRAAAHNFARLPFHQVGVDRVLADAELTKGAMYFHFRAKRELALAVIQEQSALAAEVAAELLARKLSGLETLIEFSYQLAVHDITDERCRAALHLVESMGQTGDLRTTVLGSWTDELALAVRRAVAEGDVIDDCDPHDVALLLVSAYMGLRQTSQLDEPRQFLGDLEKTWALVLPGFVRAERIDYFWQFAKRRTAIVLGSISAMPGSP